MLECVQGAENPKTLKTRRLQALIRRDRNGDRDDDDPGVEPYAHESGECQFVRVATTRSGRATQVLPGNMLLLFLQH
jgi:hypothetical protein